jgi:dephospho-CoA kinase
MVKLLVGLTGGFGTGKSTVLKIFKHLGAKTLDCDRLVKECWRSGSTVYPKLKKLLKSYGLVKQGDRTFSKREIAREVFQNPRFRRKLEKIIHPEVIRRIFLAKKRETGILVAEIPLLFETNFDRKTDYIITVKASPSKSSARVKKARGVVFKEWKARWKAQWPLGRKIRRSHAVINNSGNLKMTTRQVKKIWKDLLRAV